MGAMETINSADKMRKSKPEVSQRNMELFLLAFYLSAITSR